MKIVLVILGALTIIPSILGDTKILRNVNIYDANSQREETFSLKNADTPEEELIINGYHKQTIPSEDPEYIYRIETTYVADKDGYRVVKYSLVREKKLQFSLQLSPSTLKSVTG